MLATLMVLLMILETPFGSSVNRALDLARDRDWKAAMTALDQAWAEDPGAFEANNLHYLRGRVAEAQQDWALASDEFARIGAKNPLRPLAAWHAAYAAIKLGANQHASLLIGELPSDFPPDMRMQLARAATPPLALGIVNGMTTRLARLQRALLVGDASALWALLRENNADDVALESARRLSPLAAAPRERRDLAAAFLALRQFDEAGSAFENLAQDPQYAAEAQYQLGRIRFLQQDYPGAIERYRSVAAAFPGTDWQKDAEYQIANSYWRLRQYKEAEEAYLGYIDRYKAKGAPENAIRDLVDVYRSLGDNAKAISLIDRALAGRSTAAMRQVFLFTKGKILYSQERYSAALPIFRQMRGLRLQPAAGGTTLDEILYFEALCLSKTGNTAAAKAAWQKLAANPMTYYGQRAAERLGLAANAANSSEVCAPRVDGTLELALDRLAQRRRSFRTDSADSTDAVAELLFLQLWDEASLWINRSRQPDAALAADLSYASGRYDRAIVHAGRMPESDPRTQMLLYPAGFRRIICDAAAKYAVDPLWLHAIIWQESKYNPTALSGASARGLMQFIPDTAGAIAEPAGFPALTLDRLYDPETNIYLGAYYWSSLLAEFKEPELALAAYNGGPDNVRRWHDKWPGSGGEFFVSDIGFTETKRYVQAVFGARAAYGRPN